MAHSSSASGPLLSKLSDPWLSVPRRVQKPRDLGHEWHLSRAASLRGFSRTPTNVERFCQYMQRLSFKNRIRHEHVPCDEFVLKSMSYVRKVVCLLRMGSAAGAWKIFQNMRASHIIK